MTEPVEVAGAAVDALNGANTRNGFEVVVVHTSRAATLRALHAAAALALGRGVCIRLVVGHLVPYPLPLETPAESAAQMLSALWPELAAMPVETRVDIRLCRDFHQMLAGALAPCSVVVVPQGRLGALSPEGRLERWLRRQGHYVLSGDRAEASL